MSYKESQGSLKESSQTGKIHFSKLKRPRKPLTDENKPGRYDPRNRLNDLTGRDWLLLTSSFWVTEPSADDKDAYEHPAPFLLRDVSKLIGLLSKKGMTVLDPFAGSGTTLIAANRLGRSAIGIDLNPEYRSLTTRRYKKLSEQRNYKYLVGDAFKILDKIDTVDYIITSPPYYNILRNSSKGLRNLNGKLFRMSARSGVEFYSNGKSDLGNCSDYDEFLVQLERIMLKCYTVLRQNGYCTIIMSDFTVNKKEVCVQADIVRLMQSAGFEFSGTTVLLQPVKPLYPFGYPYAYKINHHHQNIMTFRKGESR